MLRPGSGRSGCRAPGTQGFRRTGHRYRAWDFSWYSPDRRFRSPARRTWRRVRRPDTACCHRWIDAYLEGRKPNRDTGGEFRSWRSTWVPGSFETVFVLPECHHVGRPERLMVWLGTSPPVSTLLSGQPHTVAG